MSNAHPAYMYRDPMEAAMRNEARSCKGCAFESSEHMFGQVFMLCSKDKKHGNKCNLYKLKGENIV